ncbi:MAG: HD domain-containing protein [Planctomycetaceae bacterium]|jgi:HD superfamily phosphohydrolase|nr:HD domain-containing protein [Planctomycetaceae bacterium]
MFNIPEITGLDSRIGFIRIPPELDVPLTERVRRLLDTEAFRRLARIPQVGFVSLVYPAACHTRFEHSLGVYRLALLFIRRLEHLQAFAKLVTQHDAELLIVSALLHDIGHWPFCHLVEDMSLDCIESHESLAARYLSCNEISNLLRKDWNIEPEEIFRLLNKQTSIKTETDYNHVNRSSCVNQNLSLKFLSDILSGPIDIDKMDYLYRDSLHAGVPYGRNLDYERLIGSLYVNETGDGLAITEKGKTAAELMIFARYVMFSEVYWHHAVRSASAMFQRLFCELLDNGKIEFENLYKMTESEFIHSIKSSAKGSNADWLAEGLLGSRRMLYKRVAQFGIMEQPEIYRKLAGKPYKYLCNIANRISGNILETKWLNKLPILIDAPPVEREIEIKIDVYFAKEKKYKPLEEISPVVRAMAKEQFDDYAKRVRIFAHPDVAHILRQDEKIIKILDKEL